MAGFADRVLGLLSGRAREAGRVLSAKNEGRIRSAAGALGEVLDELGVEVEESLTEAQRSLNQTQEVLANAVRSRFATGPRSYAYLMDVFDTYLVFCLCLYTYSDDGGSGTNTRTLYMVDYTVTDSDQVTFGEAVEVVQRTIYEPVVREEMVEAGLVEGDTIPLIERAIRADGTGRIKIIKAGWGSSGYYPKTVLERDGPKAFPKGTHMHIDHPTDREARERPERSVESLAAVTTADAVWEESGPDGPGLYAPIRVKPSHRADLDDVAQEIGTSIYASGKFQVGEAEGKKGRIVTELSASEHNTIDFVTRAGAGGKVLTLLESRRPQPSDPIVIAENQEDPMADNAEMIAMREALARLTERQRLTEARDLIAVELRAYESRLHPATLQRLQTALLTKAVFTEAGVDEAATKALVESEVRAELVYIARLSGDGRIAGMGASFAESQAPLKPEEIETDLAESFAALGLSGEAAKIAAEGRR